jgi:myosin-1
MRARPSYIRTIKPNQNRSATEFDTKAVLHQIKYLGLQENIRVRRAGFAYRNTFEKMVERFYLLSPNTSYAGEYTWTGDPRSGCERILTDTGIAKEEWQMGVTKAFIKNPETVSCGSQARDYALTCLTLLPAFCVGNYEGPILAQHGSQNPKGMA